MQTIAAIDIGSNAMRMLVGGVNYEGQLEALENFRLPVRLGRDVFSNGKLISEETAQLATDAMARFAKTAKEHDVEKIRAVATSAMREAQNRDLVCDRISRITGIEIEIISGEEEARLIHLAVANAVELKDKYTMAIDIGGGSVEVTLSQGRNILSSESYNMGTVRLLQKLGSQASRLPFDRLVREYAEAARRRIDAEIGGEKVELCIGTGGNIEAMGELRRKLFKRDSDKLVTVDELDELIGILSGMTVEERMQKLKLKPDRADVILPAAIVLQMIAREAGVKEVKIPNVGLKDGLLLDLAESLLETPRRTPAQQIRTSAFQLGKKYQFDADHGTLVAHLAGRLFDQTRDLHDLDPNNRILLETAALLHDIGHFIHTLDHDRHAYYILQNAPLIGVSQRERMIIANVACYHRKALPNMQDENYRALLPKDRVVVTKMAALLRLADAMDVSHTYRVRDVWAIREKNKWTIRLEGDGLAPRTLEIWALEKQRAMFNEVFGMKLEIEG